MRVVSNVFCVLSALALNSTLVGCNGKILSGTASRSTALETKSSANSDKVPEVDFESRFKDYADDTEMGEVYSDYLAIMNDTYGDDEFTLDGYQFANLRTILEDILNEPRLEKAIGETSYGEFSARMENIDMEKQAERVSAFSLSYSGQLFPQRSETKDDVKSDGEKSSGQAKSQTKLLFYYKAPVYAGLPPFPVGGPFADAAGEPIDDAPLPPAD